MSSKSLGSNENNKIQDKYPIFSKYSITNAENKLHNNKNTSKPSNSNNSKFNNTDNIPNSPSKRLLENEKQNKKLNLLSSNLLNCESNEIGESDETESEIDDIKSSKLIKSQTAKYPKNTNQQKKEIKEKSLLNYSLQETNNMLNVFESNENKDKQFEIEKEFRPATSMNFDDISVKKMLSSYKSEKVINLNSESEEATTEEGKKNINNNDNDKNKNSAYFIDKSIEKHVNEGEEDLVIELFPCCSSPSQLSSSSECYLNTKNNSLNQELKLAEDYFHFNYYNKAKQQGIKTDKFLTKSLDLKTINNKFPRKKLSSFYYNSNDDNNNHNLKNIDLIINKEKENRFIAKSVFVESKANKVNKIKNKIEKKSESNSSNLSLIDQELFQKNYIYLLIRNFPINSTEVEFEKFLEEIDIDFMKIVYTKFITDHHYKCRTGKLVFNEEEKEYVFKLFKKIEHKRFNNRKLQLEIE